MPTPLVLLSIPALYEKDVTQMKYLREMTVGGQSTNLVPSIWANARLVFGVMP